MLKITSSFTVSELIYKKTVYEVGNIISDVRYNHNDDEWVERFTSRVERDSYFIYYLGLLLNDEFTKQCITEAGYTKDISINDIMIDNGFKKIESADRLISYRGSIIHRIIDLLVYQISKFRDINKIDNFIFDVHYNDKGIGISIKIDYGNGKIKTKIKNFIDNTVDIHIIAVLINDIGGSLNVDDTSIILKIPKQIKVEANLY